MAPRDQASVRGFPPTTKPQKHASLAQERAPTLLPLQPLGKAGLAQVPWDQAGGDRGLSGGRAPASRRRAGSLGRQLGCGRRKACLVTAVSSWWHSQTAPEALQSPCSLGRCEGCREFVPTSKNSQTKGALWFCRGWEVPGDPAVCPLSPCSSESHHRCPNPSLPSHRGLCSPPPTSQQKGWSQTEISGLFSNGPEFSGGCRSGPGGLRVGLGDREPFL